MDIVLLYVVVYFVDDKSLISYILWTSYYITKSYYCPSSTSYYQYNGDIASEKCFFDTKCIVMFLCSEEIFLQYFQVILKHSLQNISKILKYNMHSYMFDIFKSSTTH